MVRVKLMGGRKMKIMFEKLRLILKYKIRKNKRGSNGMEPNWLIPSYNNLNKSKYLNVLVKSNRSRAGMAEWLTQLVDTQSSLRGLVGSIPTSSATGSNKVKSKGDKENA